MRSTSPDHYGAIWNTRLLLSCIVLVAVCASSMSLLANDVLIVQRHDGTAVSFAVEQARDAATHKEGLMWREHLAPRSGMLFDFHRSQRIKMWMKNTLIALDMLFVSESGVIVQIERNTTPKSLDIIVAVEPVRYVLEINAGETDELGIMVGDRILIDDNPVAMQSH
jgi:uncharacterized membrane protein (UPF0127 family)